MRLLVGSSLPGIRRNLQDRDKHLAARPPSACSPKPEAQEPAHDPESLDHRSSLRGHAVGGFALCRTRAEPRARWKQLRELARDGLTLGSHTRTHPVMTQVTRAQMREEVQGSLEDLKREIGACLPIFCYPNGNYNDTVVSVLRDQGIRLAFTT